MADMTILGLAEELNQAACNLRSRTRSLADSLGGTQPDPGAKGETAPNDIHSSLQRALSVLHETKVELLRCEEVTGLCPMPATESPGLQQRHR